MSSEPDIVLVRRFLKGDEEAFDMLIGRYERPLYYYILRMVRDHDDAADICQNTFVQVFRKVRGFMARSNFKTWLYRIATNEALNYFRSKGADRTEPLEEEHAPIADPLSTPSGEDSEMKNRLRQSIDGLPEKQRATLILRVYQELSFREIGHIMVCSEGTAKVNYYYAVKTLRKEMSEDNGLHQN